MKKLLLACAFLLFASVVFAGNRYSTITSSGAVLDSRRTLCGLYITTDGTNNVTVELYENSAASGRRVIGAIVAPAAERLYGANLASIDVSQLYVNITTAGTASVTIVHGKGTCD